MKKIKIKKVLVTGGLGFIGSNLVDSLIKHGHKVVVVDRNKPSFFKPLNSKAKHCQMDFGSVEINKVFKKEKPDAVIHLAALISVPNSIKDPIRDAENNIMSSLRLLEAARKCGTKRFLFASSGGAIYGDYPLFPTPELRSVKPLSPYGIGKQTFEYYLFFAAKEYGLSTLVLRMSNVYGPRQGLGGESGVAGIFCKKIVMNEPVNIFSFGKETRDHIFIDDVVEAYHKALDSKIEGFINISTGKEVSTKKFFEILVKISGKKVEDRLLPPRSNGEVVRSAMDNRLAQKKLNWKPKTSLEDGLKKTYDWFEKNKFELNKKLP